jgi:hypothetical protein
MKLPTFICVGAQKSGTTTLNDILTQHPEIYLPEIKETKFFHRDHLYKKGIKYYSHEFFSSVSNEKIIGEIDPEYMYFEYVPKRIYETLGSEVKLIFILRNPIDRAYSHYLMSKRRGFENLSFEEAINKEQIRIQDKSHDTRDWTQKNHFSYITRGLYSQQIENYLKYFPKKNMHFILFEDEFVKNKSDTIDKLLNFLEVNTGYNLNLYLKSNEAKDARSYLFAALLNKPNILKKAIKKMIPYHIRRLMKDELNKINMKSLKKEDLPNDVRLRLYNRYFKKEINSLTKLIDKDLSSWNEVKKFNNR